jgi:hypothetical protein
VVPLASLGTLGARQHTVDAVASAEWQARVRIFAGASLAVGGGFLLSMWTVRATWALFFS